MDMEVLNIGQTVQVWIWTMKVVEVRARWQRMYVPWSREKGWDIVIAGIRFLICARLQVGSLRVSLEEREDLALDDTSNTTTYLQLRQRWGHGV